MQKQIKTITINRLRSSMAVNQNRDDKNANRKKVMNDTTNDGVIRDGISCGRNHEKGQKAYIFTQWGY